ncbi:membrane dipeptidase [Prescottella subtropica]|uniref:membrane dipeptidase n=1 Tax=Prescottella subtropica TaxID=2545757 RepID=UPI0010F6C71D|nr:membrane dipeptidase [Prescottella subtropica]
MTARSGFVRRRAVALLGAVVAVALTGASATAVPLSPLPADPGPVTDPVYGLAGGCYTLAAAAGGGGGQGFVARDGAGFRSGADAASATPFRMQAAQLGRFLFVADDATMVAGGPAGVTASAQAVPDADWTVTSTDGVYTATGTVTGRQLIVGGDGRLTVADPGTAPGAGDFRLAAATGCADVPEADVNATGVPSGTDGSGQVRGFVDTHVHMNANEFIGGEIRCGEPYSPLGVTVALRDCDDHGPDGATALLENVLSHGTPFDNHDTTMWPSFADVPAYDSMTHEQTYYRWVERAWRGGLRIFSNLLVSNRVLCELYPLRSNPCDEMETVRIQARQAYGIQDYVDARYGGPGRGWFRIVSSPAEARAVAASGKLAVTLGVEISEPFGCGIRDGVAQCTEADIDAGLDELHGLGVRQVILAHKFDNALGGVRFDEGITGIAVNAGNFLGTGRFWETQPCVGVAKDNPIGNVDTDTARQVAAVLPPGVTLPVYPEGPSCNARGLTDLGAYAVRALMSRGMIVDVDHMSAKTADAALTILEDARYSGVVSSHSWTDPSNYPRIYRLGGFVASYASPVEEFVEDWRTTRTARDDDYFFGFGYGADTNGFGAQPAPPKDGRSLVTYPFTTFDGTVMDRQQAGTRVFDFDTDGLAQYGLTPDWIEAMRTYAGADGDQFMADMTRGAEAYLQMWERAAR